MTAQIVSKWIPSALFAGFAAIGFALTPSLSRADHHEGGHTASKAAAAVQGAMAGQDVAQGGQDAHPKGECSCDHECTEKCSKDDHASCACKTCDCSKGQECEHGKCKHHAKKVKAKASKKVKGAKVSKKAEDSAQKAPATGADPHAH